MSIVRSLGRISPSGNTTRTTSGLGRFSLMVFVDCHQVNHVITCRHNIKCLSPLPNLRPYPFTMATRRTPKGSMQPVSMPEPSESCPPVCVSRCQRMLTMKQQVSGTSSLLTAFHLLIKSLPSQYTGTKRRCSPSKARNAGAACLSREAGTTQLPV